MQNISVHCSLLINWIYPTIYIKYEVSIPNYSKINTETGILLEHLAFLLENRSHSSFWLLIFLGSRKYNTKATQFRCHSGYFFCLARNASFSRSENRIGVCKKRCDRTMAKCQVTVWCGTREERRLDFQVHNCRLSFDWHCNNCYLLCVLSWGTHGEPTNPVPFHWFVAIVYCYSLCGHSSVCCWSISRRQKGICQTVGSRRIRRTRTSEADLYKTWTSRARSLIEVSGFISVEGNKGNKYFCCRC